MDASDRPAAAGARCEGPPIRRRAVLAAGAGLLGLSGCLGRGREPPPSGTYTIDAGDGEVRVTTLATGLEVPWGAAFREGTLFLTERPGRIGAVRGGSYEVVADLTDTTHAVGEGGLMGLAFHPRDPDVAFSYQTYRSGGRTRNRLLRHDATDGFAHEVAFDGIPGATRHDGGRLLAGEAALYATTGDATDGQAAQDTDSLAGKVLRLTPDAEPHPDNPFGNAVYTYGHRNPQGLAVDGDRLLSTEHGPDHDDEVNVLEAGGNYGWPAVMGTSDGRYVDPVATYTPPVAPGSATVYAGPIDRWRGDLLFGTLAGRHLHRLRVDGRTVEADERLFEGTYGRLRTAFTGPEGRLHLTTSNRDGRGAAVSGDDRVLRIEPV